MAIRKIVVGTDFSELADIAVTQALHIARTHGAELVLLHVGNVPEHNPEIPPSLKRVAAEYDEMQKQRFAQTRRDLESLRERIDGQGATVSHVIMHGYPDEAIPQAVEELDADLLVVGTRGQTGFRRFVMGSVAERAVRLTKRDVLVARPKAGGEGGYGKILVPIDFSDHTKPTVDAAFDMVAPGGSIEFFYAWEVPGVSWAQELWGPEWAKIHRDISDNNQRRYNRLLDTLPRGRNVQLSFVDQQVRPTVGIQQRAEKGDVELIVMGSHGNRGIKRWAYGSVAEVTVRHAPCSVLIVHRKETT